MQAYSFTVQPKIFAAIFAAHGIYYYWRVLRVRSESIKDLENYYHNDQAAL